MTEEPTITINGKLCSKVQAMTIRVALEAFSVDLQSGLGDDDHGRSMTANYNRLIDEIRQMIFAPTNE